MVPVGSWASAESRAAVDSHVEPDVVAVRWPYCGTDSLVGNDRAAGRRLHTKLRRELRTLRDAARALRARRLLLIWGMTAAAILLGALDLAILPVYVGRRRVAKLRASSER